MFIDKIQLRNGITQYTYWEELIDVPLGILWVKIYTGNSGKQIAFLQNAMTAYYFRNKGICSVLHNAVLNDTDVLLTCSGSDEGGKEFLIKFGFKYNKDLDIWSFIKRR